MQIYLDCFSGISGDMFTGALIDAGVPVEWLADQIALLHLPVTISAKPVHKKGLSTTLFQVSSTEKFPSHRHLSDILAIIEKSDLPLSVKKKSTAIFQNLAQAESRAHGIDIEKVHFHEVGALDAIVDVVSAVLCVEYLRISRIIASPIAVGSGWVECEHGKLPVPLPAVLNLLEDIPITVGQVSSELTTPTGAAIVRTLATEFSPMPSLRIQKTGYGAGTKEFMEVPNVLRVYLFHAETLSEEIGVMETMIDDMTPEFSAHLQSLLLANGALDVGMIPVYMKKNRPGTKFEILYPIELEQQLSDLIFENSTTIGLRFSRVHRRTLSRKKVFLQTPYGPLAAKEVTLPSRQTRHVPEYEAVQKMALQHKISAISLYHTVVTCPITEDPEHD